MTIFDGWADLYDKVYAWKQDDIDFYVEESVKTGGPILELGCGTGRVTIPIAKAGLNIVGLDNSPKMIDCAKSKAKQIPFINNNVSWVEGDMRSISLNQKFALIIIPYRSFLSLLNIHDQRKCLESVREHLLPNGKLIFDIFVPDLETLSDISLNPVHLWDVGDLSNDHSFVIWDQSRFDNHNQIIDVRLIIDELNGDMEMLRRVYRDFQLRYLHRFETQYLLELSGYRILETYGGFTREDIDKDSTNMVWVVADANII